MNQQDKNLKNTFKTKIEKEIQNIFKKGFNVILKSVGKNKIEIIKLVKEITNINVEIAKYLVEKVPFVIREGIGKEEAIYIKNIFEKKGAIVEIEKINVKIL